MTDPEVTQKKHGVGGWVQLSDGEWHRSVAFDGREHELACETSVLATCSGDSVDVDDWQGLHRTPPEDEACDDCWSFWREEINRLEEETA